MNPPRPPPEPPAGHPLLAPVQPPATVIAPISNLLLETEAALAAAAGNAAERWRGAALQPLLVGLRGDLGSGKTTWVRAMLRGLGYAGRVPSPTYTLVEQYGLDGLTVAHLDLYRLTDEEDLENLGVRDLLADPRAWLLVEWPERAAGLAARCDLDLALAIQGESARRLTGIAHTAAGRTALDAMCDFDSSKTG